MLQSLSDMPVSFSEVVYAFKDGLAARIGEDADQMRL